MTTSTKKNNNSLESLKSYSFQKILFGMLILIVSLSLTQCANMQKPTGGPKDSIPPVLLSITPENLTRNFKEKEIVLTFDEFIKTVNPQKEFSISPDTETQPIYKVRKKNFIIQLRDSLKENTT